MVRLPEPNQQIRLAPVRVLRAVFSGVGQLLMAADRLREEDAEQARETRDEQQDPLATWDGRLSSSVRLIPPTGDDPDLSPPARAKPDSSPPARAKPTASRPARAKPTPAKKAKQAEPADVKRAKATNASGSRKSGRSKTVAEPSKFRSLDLTGNVRMLSGTEIADMAADEFERSAAARPNPPAAESDPISGTADTATPPWSQAAPSWSSWSTGAEATALDPAAAAGPSSAAVDLPITGYDELSLPSLRARLRNLDADQLAVLLAYERSHANREDVATMFERRIARLAETQNRAGAQE